MPAKHAAPRPILSYIGRVNGHMGIAPRQAQQKSFKTRYPMVAGELYGTASIQSPHGVAEISAKLLHPFSKSPVAKQARTTENDKTGQPL
jgi:hypothetical protein